MTCQIEPEYNHKIIQDFNDHSTETIGLSLQIEYILNQRPAAW